jgi:hypothetical protein
VKPEGAKHDACAVFVPSAVRRRPITVDAEAKACAIVLAREGFDTRDLKEAKALLEVKRRAVHRVGSTRAIVTLLNEPHGIKPHRPLRDRDEQRQRRASHE